MPLTSPRRDWSPDLLQSGGFAGQMKQTLSVCFRKNFDGFVKTPHSLLHFIPRCFNVRLVRIIAMNSRASNVTFYTLPSEAVSCYFANFNFSSHYSDFEMP
jgi:hypothetical protein